MVTFVLFSSVVIDTLRGSSALSLGCSAQRVMCIAAMSLHESGILRLAPPSFNRIAVAWREKPGSQHRSHFEKDGTIRDTQGRTELSGASDAYRSAQGNQEPGIPRRAHPGERARAHRASPTCRAACREHRPLPRTT